MTHNKGPQLSLLWFIIDTLTPRPPGIAHYHFLNLIFSLTQTISLIRLADLSKICGVRAGSRCLEA